MGDLGNAGECLHRGAELVDESDLRTAVRPADRAPAWRNLAALQAFLQQPEAASNIEKAINAMTEDTPSWILRARIRLTVPGLIDPAEALDDAKFADRAANNQDGLAKRLRALAYLRVAPSHGEAPAGERAFAKSAEDALEAIQLGDMPAINHLIIAISQANRKNPAGARDHLIAAISDWPVELDESDFAATYHKGVLWFESAEQLYGLRVEAESLIN